jgi:WS/DGAT/MGAT family acyltransferase
MMERLTVADATFLELEDQVSAMHNVTIAIFNNPEPTFVQLRERVEDRIRAVPRLRQRVVPVPLGLGRPVWIDDDQFDLEFHLRHTGLPTRANMGDFRNLVGRLLSQRLDRGKPLWELWMVSGLPNKRWALLSKAHYSIVDGVSGADPLSLIIDQSKEGGTADSWSPRPRPSDGRLLINAAAGLAVNPYEQVRLLRRTVLNPMVQATDAIGKIGTRASDAGLVGAVGPHRRWYEAAVDGEVIRELRDRHDVATNDVILALITRGFRSMLESQGKALPESLRTLVPLAVATGDDFANQVSAFEADLPVGSNSFDDAVTLIRDETAHVTSRNKAVAGATLAGLPGLIAPTLCSLGLRSASQAGARLTGVDTVTVNAPGPNHRVSLLDRTMVNLYPAIPLAAQVRIAVGVMSYRGMYGFGVTGDRNAGLEIAALAEGIEHAAAAAAE